METSRIASTIQTSLTATRVAGGSVGSGDAAGPSGPTTEGQPSAVVADGSSSASGSGGGSDSAEVADEGGDADDGQPAARASGNPNLVVDLSRVSAPPSQIEVPITSGGNSSLWLGADGIEAAGDEKDDAAS